MTRITDAGLGITAMMTVTLDQVNAEEFLQLYKGVVQEFPLMVIELSCGPCIAMEICGHDAQSVLRELVGPPDPVCHTSLARSEMGRRGHTALTCYKIFLRPPRR